MSGSTPKIWFGKAPSVPKGFTLTGEFRSPLAGEWYLSGAIPEAYQAPNDLNDLSTAYHILKPLPGKPLPQKARRAKSKLYRNLVPGDRFRVWREDGKTDIVTVSHVRECPHAWFSGRRQWEVLGNYPWWWTAPIRAYANERVDLV